jgi:hypothetical protein
MIAFQHENPDKQNFQSSAKEDFFNTICHKRTASQAASDLAHDRAVIPFGLR